MDPIAAVTDPIGAVADPIAAVVGPIGAVVDPIGAVVDPTDAVADPIAAVANLIAAVADPIRDGRIRGAPQAGSMLRLVRNTFSGSHAALTSASRARAGPSAASTRSRPSSSVRKLM